MDAHQEQQAYRCRGYRKWCDSRCERTTPGPILGYPEMGYYCNVHRYQAPEEDPDGRYIPSSEFLPFLRRETSYRCKEDILAEGLKQYREKTQNSYIRVATFEEIIRYLMEQKGMSESKAKDTFQDMVVQGNLKEMKTHTSNQRVEIKYEIVG